jgi:centromere protein C
VHTNFLGLIGNFYSIENDYSNPARIFFSQGCEISERAEAETSVMQ